MLIRALATLFSAAIVRMFPLLKGHAMDTLDRLMTRKELAEMLQVNVNTIQRWHWKGESAPPFMKIGRSVRYKKRDVMEWLWRRAGVGGAAVVVEG
jgi:excisionase family DNA binding protein